MAPRLRSRRAGMERQVTPAELHAAIEATLGEVPCPAVDVVYCVAVRDALRARLPSATLDVYFTTTAFTVSATSGDTSGDVSARMTIPLT